MRLPLLASFRRCAPPRLTPYGPCALNEHAPRLDDKTAKKYVHVFEQLFLIRRVEPWFRNRLKRLVKTPCLHFLDSGLLAAISGITRERIARDRAVFGYLLETFVFSEVLKQSAWLDERSRITETRTRTKSTSWSPALQHAFDICAHAIARVPTFDVV